MSNENETITDCIPFTGVERLFRDDMSLLVEGYGIGLLASFGVILNMVGIYQSTKKLSRIYNCLLLPVVCFDLLYLVCKIFNSYDVVFGTTSNSYITTYQTLVYPLSQIVMTASIFMTTALTYDQYCAVIRPIQHRNLMSSVHDRHKRALKYFFIVIIAASVFNLPSFWEMTTAQDSSDGSIMLQPSKLRLNPYYKGFYTVVAQCLILLILPFCFLVFFNYSIFMKGHNRPQFQMTTELRCHHEQKKINSHILYIVVILFFCCHALSGVMTCIELAVLNDTIISTIVKNECNLALWIQVLEHVNQFLLVIGSCTNVIAYLVLSNTCTNVNFHICNNCNCCAAECCDGNSDKHVVAMNAPSAQSCNNDIELHLQSDIAVIKFTTLPKPSTADHVWLR